LDLNSKQTYHVLGIMSGTSLDGIDLAECFFQFDATNGWSYEIGKVETIPYTPEWTNRLGEGIHFSKGRLNSLDLEYTHYLAAVIRTFLDAHGLTNLDAVCSHGHTILHRPEKGITLQIGNLPILAALIQQKVVCDFRVQDVAMGGQGAPLVPIGDKLLFSDYDYCLNLGGFANVSFDFEGERIAYDICPVNIVLNRYAQVCGKAYDDKGELARSGTVNKRLLGALNSLSFYQKSAPKSLGLEWVQQYIFPLLAKDKIAPEDSLATFTEHVAFQLAAQFEKGATVLVSGGGTYNDFLLERLLSYKLFKVTIPSEKIIEYKEALVFGLLGVLRIRGEYNCLSSVTGARKDHCSGRVVMP
jgi:anhydro-N-acetylmuramic acid kinase